MMSALSNKNQPVNQEKPADKELPVNQEKPTNRELPVNQEKGSNKEPPVIKEKPLTKKKGQLRKVTSQIEDSPEKNEGLKKDPQPKTPCIFCFKELNPKSMKEHTRSQKCQSKRQALEDIESGSSPNIVKKVKMRIN